MFKISEWQDCIQSNTWNSLHSLSSSPAPNIRPDLCSTASPISPPISLPLNDLNCYRTIRGVIILCSLNISPSISWDRLVAGEMVLPSGALASCSCRAFWLGSQSPQEGSHKHQLVHRSLPEPSIPPCDSDAIFLIGHLYHEVLLLFLVHEGIRGQKGSISPSVPLLVRLTLITWLRGSVNFFQRGALRL